MSGVTLESVTKRYGSTDVIHGVTLEIEDGEFLVFVGPSGCGKSTLLRMIAGLEGVSSGDISIGGKNVLPTIWIVSMSFKPNEALLRSTSGFLPLPFTLENYANLIKLSATPRWLFNSIVVAGTMTVITLVLSSLAGYAFARLEFRGRKVLFVVVLAGFMVPEQAVFIPLQVMFGDLGLHNTHMALILPRIAVPFGVFLMTQFFRAIPKELEEAAQLDHATHWQIFTKIILPLSTPALTTLGLFTFMYAWNDYLWPLVSATDKSMFTVTVGLASIQGNFAQTEGLASIMASAVFASLPILIIYLIFQRHIISGISMGADK